LLLGAKTRETKALRHLDRSTEQRPRGVSPVAVVHQHAHQNDTLEILQRVRADKVARPLARAGGAVPRVRERLHLLIRKVLLGLGVVHKVEAELMSEEANLYTHSDHYKVHCHERHRDLVNNTFPRQRPEVAALAQECRNVEHCGQNK
jgi:hypothetical protein